MYEGEPFVEIVVQPKQRVRFRYESEKSCAAIIYGENSLSHQKTYPTIRIRNYSGKATLIVSCVSNNEPHCPHPHKLVGETRNFHFRSGACCGEVTTTHDGEIQLPGVGIQRTKRDLIRNALQERKAAGIDPFRTNFAISERGVNLHAVCLCFQVYLPDLSGKYGRALPPVVSKVIQDKKSINDLAIMRVSRSSGSTRGGDEVFLLCETVNKEDIRVRFYDENDRGEVVWESFGTFAPIDVYHGNAIVFKTPSYPSHMSDGTQDKVVSMQLYRPSTEESSRPVLFTYMLHHQDPDWIEERRGRKRLKPMPDVLHAGNAATFDIARPVSVSADRSSPIVTSTALLASAVCLPTVLSGMNSLPPTQSTNPQVAYDHFLDVSPNHAATSASHMFSEEIFVGLPTHAAEGTLTLAGATQAHDSQFCGGDSQVNSFTTFSCVPEVSFLQRTTTAAAAATATTTAVVPVDSLFRVDAGTVPTPDATSAANTPCPALRDAYENTSSIKSLNSLLDSLINTGEP